MFSRDKSSKGYKAQAKAIDYEKLGKSLEGVLIRDYLELLQKPRRQMWLAFLRGVAGGLGGIIGATLVVALLLFVLSQLGGLPFVGETFRNLSHSLSSTPHK